MMSEVLTATKSFIDLYSKSGLLMNPADRSPESDYEIALQHIRFAEQLFPTSCIALCPRSHVTHYISGNCEKVLGHTHDVLRNSGLLNIVSYIHPDDILSFRQCLEFINGCKSFEPGAHRFLLNFRLRDNRGHYRHIRNEHIALKTQASNYLFLILFNDVSDIEKFHHVRLDVLKSVKGTISKIYEYNPKQVKQVMTPRQYDIARLIAKGFSNQEIADQLSVSIFTVKNHKQLLFKKVNVKNSMELASSSLMSA